MKLNKILAVALSLSVFATSVISVSAAFSYENADGMIMITEMPAKADVEARKPDVAVTVENIPNENFAAVDAVFNNLYGKKTDSATGAYLYDMYKVTYTFTNFGDLALGYSSDKSGVGLINMTADIKVADGTDANIKASKYKSSSLAGFASNHGLDSETKVITNSSYTSEVANPYPGFGSDEMGSINTVTSLELVTLYAVNAGTQVKFSLENSTGMTYVMLNDGTPSNVPVYCTLPAENSFVLSAAKPEPTEPTVTGTDAGVAVTGAAAVNGKVWNNVVVENVALGTNYRAQFSIGDDKSDEYVIENFANAEVNGTATFAVVLKTAKDVANAVLNILYDTVQ